MKLIKIIQQQLHMTPMTFSRSWVKRSRQQTFLP